MAAKKKAEDTQAVAPPAGEDAFKDAPPACKGCVLWTQFRKDCHYFWENKKHCTMWAGSFDQVQPTQ